MNLADYVAASDAGMIEIARALGVNRSTLFRWLTGDREPTARWANRIAEVTRGAVPVSVWGTPPPPRTTPGKRNRTPISAVGRKGRRVRGRAA